MRWENKPVWSVDKWLLSKVRWYKRLSHVAEDEVIRKTLIRVRKK